MNKQTNNWTTLTNEGNIDISITKKCTHCFMNLSHLYQASKETRDLRSESTSIKKGQ